ncbi:MAG: SRPBCC family protein [Rheinheimera sp.]|nr:SRPBCC family protein [Gammaproteobacteria bacterium]MDZ7904142.1 SRPBCC family protein [Rheinheimera sp.]
MSGNTLQLFRVIKATPNLVYRAFLDPAALCKWLPPNGYTCNVEHLDAVVGGSFKMSFCNFASGESHSFGGNYLALTPFEFIQYTDVFDDPNLSGVITVSIRLKAVSCGTELHIEQAGIPEQIPLEMCHLGWQDSLVLLQKLLEVPNS